MVIQPEPVDPLDEELERLLADPDIQTMLREAREEIARGDAKLIPHEEARRRLGLDPPTPTS